MLTLLYKELRFNLNSLSGIIFIMIFFIISGCLLWVIPGEYNIPESGYASLAPFLSFSPIVLMLLIPALSMRTFSEEKQHDTLSLLYSRPINLTKIIFAKILGVFITVCVAIFSTIVYVISLYFLSIPVGNIDIGAITGSYCGLLFLSFSFISISIFASSLTSNQVLAFILGLLICSGFYFGFDLVSDLFSSGKTQLFVRNLGFLYHFQSVQRGCIDSGDLLYMLFVSGLFFLLTVVSLRLSLGCKFWISSILILVVLFICSFILQIRFDLTIGKRYTISDQTKNLLEKIDKPMVIDFYLDGNLNSGFVRLQQAAYDLLSDFSSMSSGNIKINMVNPYHVEHKDFISELEKKGIKGVAVNEKDAEGKMSQHIIFPWAIVKYDGIEVPVSLLTNISGRSGSQNLNTSIEMLEYQFATTIQLLLSRKSNPKIAFLDGHGELSNAYLTDAINLFSYFYQIDRGILSTEPGQLNQYKLVIVAGPRDKFSETDKYILDQYLMQGGKILWLVDGAKIKIDELTQFGETPSMANDVNLDDMLFNYGVRVNPLLLQDIQCVEIPVNTKPESDQSSYVPKPWYFAPLLTPNQMNNITKDLLPIESKFASTLTFVGKDDDIKKYVLLSSSDLAHIVQVPEMISLYEVERKPDKAYFNQQNLPVAALLEGVFMSVFRDRIVPSDIYPKAQTIQSSISTKMIVIATSSIIQNEVTKIGDSTENWPMGYDRFSGTQFGNRDFILNAVNYLTDDAGLMLLRNKTFKISLLDRHKSQQFHSRLLFFNVLLPSFIIMLFFLSSQIFRKRKYKSRSWK